MLLQSCQSGYIQQTSGELSVTLALSHPRRKDQGELEIKVGGGVGGGGERDMRKGIGV